MILFKRLHQTLHSCLQVSYIYMGWAMRHQDGGQSSLPNLLFKIVCFTLESPHTSELPVQHSPSSLDDIWIDSEDVDTTRMTSEQI